MLYNITVMILAITVVFEAEILVVVVVKELME